MFNNMEKRKKSLLPLTRILTAIASLILVLVIFLPIWRIELDAPQYPEGLAMQIYAHKLAGDVEIINGLNHYIGMRTLHEDDFMEFTFLPYIFAGFALLGLIAAAAGRRWLFFTWAFGFLLFAVLAMVDFYMWEYDYGHNLDPKAPIQVPGMAYQPPLIGFKQLLNFGAFSIPDTGGWILTGVGLIAIFLIFRELKNKRHEATSIH